MYSLSSLPTFLGPQNGLLWMDFALYLFANHALLLLEKPHTLHLEHQAVAVPFCLGRQSAGLIVKLKALTFNLFYQVLTQIMYYGVLSIPSCDENLVQVIGEPPLR
jgi:hypothetical protein